MQDALQEFGSDYAAAWSSHDPERVASFFAPAGSLSVNDGDPAVGRAALADLAQGFFTELPDLVVVMDGIEQTGEKVVFQWTLTATSVAGRPVRISGQENWRLDEFGQIAESLGSFDAADYARQLGG